MIRNSKSLLFAIFAAMTASGPATAGTYGDDFGKCLVSSSTDADKRQLMQWIFSAISLNPEVAPYVSIPAEKRAQFDKEMAALFERLVGTSCQKEASEALKYEGTSAFGTAFQLLGQVAGQQLFASPEVSAGSDAFIKLVDIPALQEKLGVKADKP